MPTRTQTVQRVSIAAVFVLAFGVGLWWLLAPSATPKSAPEPQRAESGPEAPAATSLPALPRGAATTASPPSRVAAAPLAEFGGRMVGRAVSAEDGAPLPGAAATAERVAPAGPHARSTSGSAAGGFVVERLHTGTYDVLVRAPRHLPRRLTGVAVTGGEQTDLGEVALTPGAFVTGRVVDAATGAPLAGAVARCESGDGAAAPRGVADDRGEFVLGPLPAGATPVRVSRVGYDVLRLPEVRLPDGGAAALGELRLRPRAGASPGAATDDAPIGEAGPGLSLVHRAQGVVVGRVAPGSPAADAALVPGTRVTAVDGYPADDLSPDQLVALLHGARGTRVALAVARSASDAPVVIHLERR